MYLHLITTHNSTMSLLEHMQKEIRIICLGCWLKTMTNSHDHIFAVMKQHPYKGNLKNIFHKAKIYERAVSLLKCPSDSVSTLIQPFKLGLTASQSIRSF